MRVALITLSVLNVKVCYCRAYCSTVAPRDPYEPQGIDGVELPQVAGGSESILFSVNTVDEQESRHVLDDGHHDDHNHGAALRSPNAVTFLSRFSHHPTLTRVSHDFVRSARTDSKRVNSKDRLGGIHTTRREISKFEWHVLQANHDAQ
jgi:hypothetical protein